MLLYNQATLTQRRTMGSANSSCSTSTQLVYICVQLHILIPTRPTSPDHANKGAPPPNSQHASMFQMRAVRRSSPSSKNGRYADSVVPSGLCSDSSKP